MGIDSPVAEVIRASEQMSGLSNATLSRMAMEMPLAPSKYTVGSIQFAPTIGLRSPQVPFFDGRIVPGFGSASKQTIDIAEVKKAIVTALDALIDLHGKLNATPTR